MTTCAISEVAELFVINTKTGFSCEFFCAKIYTIGAIAEEADKLLFKKVMSANHCIHFCCPLLSPAVIVPELKDIHMSSPDVNMNYITKSYSSLSV